MGGVIITAFGGGDGAQGESYKHIDTVHGSAPIEQRWIGDVLKLVQRNAYFLTIRVPAGNSKAKTMALLEHDLDKLGVNHSDMMVLQHTSEDGTPCEAAVLQEQWAALESFYHDGKVRAIGVANFSTALLDVLMQTAVVPPMVNQILYHAGMGDDPNGLVSYAKAHNITLEACGALADQEIASGEPYKSIGERYNKTGQQVALRWLLQHDPPVSYIVPDSVEMPSIYADALHIYDFELSADEMAEISSALLLV